MLQCKTYTLLPIYLYLCKTFTPLPLYLYTCNSLYSFTCKPVKPQIALPWYTIMNLRLYPFTCKTVSPITLCKRNYLSILRYIKILTYRSKSQKEKQKKEKAFTYVKHFLEQFKPPVVYKSQYPVVYICKAYSWQKVIGKSVKPMVSGL